MPLREELFYSTKNKSFERVLVNAFIVKIVPENLIDGIKRGCRRVSCLTEDVSKKNFMCKGCGFETSYFYNFDIFIQLNPNSLELIKVNLNTIKELEGEGLIKVDANLAFRDISLLEQWIKELTNPLVFHNLCIELPSWKIIGKYSALKNE